MFYFLLFLVINLISYGAMADDKQRSIQKEWRISNNTFYLLSLFGGFIGTYFGMKHFRHKTKQPMYYFIVFVSFLIWSYLIFFK